MEIIVRGSQTCNKTDNRKLDDLHKDVIHRRRKEVEGELRKTMFSKDKMWQTDCRDKSDEKKRVEDYDRWKQTKTGLGKTNEQLMSEWGNLNREFKRRNEEGKPQCLDFVRARKNVKYE